MKRSGTTLYSLAAPLALLPVLPVMEFSFSQIGPFLRGTEFQTLVAEVLTQVFSGFAAAVIELLTGGIFGALGAA